MPIPLGILAVAGAGAAAGGAYELIESRVTSGFDSQIVFSNLGSLSQYKHLQLRIVYRGQDQYNEVIEMLKFRFNSDTAANYNGGHKMLGGFATGGGVQSQWGGTGSDKTFTASGPLGSTTANVFACAVVDLLDFSSTTKYKTLRGIAGHILSNTPSNGNRWEVSLNSGLWLSTAAVTSITITANGLNYVTGTRFSLYGIKG